MTDSITYKTEPNSKEELVNILNPTVKQWFFSKFKEFSKPQLFGVMEIHSRNNLLVSAPTGATKTLTGFLAILNELIDSSQKGLLEDRIYCIYISPLKALSNDIHKNLVEPLEEMDKIAGKNLGIRVNVRTGDTTQYEKSKMLKKPPHIMITTPESLAILLASTKFRNHLAKTEWVIIDEIHALAENKRGVHLSLSLERLQRSTGHLTRIGLSATISPIEEIAKYLVGYDSKTKELRPCKIIDVQFAKELDLKIIAPVKNLIDTDFESKHSALYEMLDKLIQEHKTTLIFTNTRSATERVVHNLKDKFPTNYLENIGAHHGSLAKDMRRDLEERLRQGKLKCVVTSTSLELGIDIGYIDLVLCLGSPKSIARFLQRAGRAGHKLHEKIKARIIVLDRDDLVECAVLLKSAVERRIDKIHIPINSLDVLAQHIHGIALEQESSINDVLDIIHGSYCFKNTSRKDVIDLIEYLSGKFADLSDRHIYAKIWYDEETQKIGKKGKMSRVLHITNIGTIPEESFVEVKVGNQTVGSIDESFLERLRSGDVFVLGGHVYEFKYARGLTAQVNASVDRPPTVPSWFSEMLPLSFDLALEIGRFRRLMDQKLCAHEPKKDIIEFMKEYLHVDTTTAEAIYSYFNEQFLFLEIPNDTKILVEVYSNDDKHYYVFHSLFGRRVNDALSRAVALVLSRIQRRNVDIGISDNGFLIVSKQPIQAINAFSILKSSELYRILKTAIDKTEILGRRFRQCAARSLMILRNYKGKTKRVGRQQVSSMILLSAVRRISNDFPILKEARREVLEDLMDIESAKIVLTDIESGKIKVRQVTTKIPSPFAFSLVTQGYTDTLRIEDKTEFLRRMHQMVLAGISNKQAKKNTEGTSEKQKTKDKEISDELFDYNTFWHDAQKQADDKKDKGKELLREQLWNIKKAPRYVKSEIARMIDGDKDIRKDVLDAIEKHKKNIRKDWPKELQEFVLERAKELRD